MPDVWMARVGRRLAPTDTESEEALRRLPPNHLVRVRIIQSRSAANHRHLFAGIAAAARGWPEATEPNPEGDAERLRAWLLIQAGYQTFEDFPLSAQGALSNVIAEARKGGRHWFTDEAWNGRDPVLRLRMPRSISWSVLDEREFQQIKEKIDTVILAVTGASLDQWVTGDMEAA